MCWPYPKQKVEEIVAYCREQGLSWLVLGNASNLIVRDGGIRDVVIMLTEMKEIKVAGTTMIVDAGAKLIDTTYEALAADLTGFEFACGIPGSVGGAVYMNAGAYGGEIKMFSICRSAVGRWNYPNHDERRPEFPLSS